MRTEMQRGFFFYTTVFVLPLVTVVIILQWLLVFPCEKISLSFGEKTQEYLLDGKVGSLESNFILDNIYEKFSVVRQTKNTLSVVGVGGEYQQYQWDKGKLSYRLVQSSKEKYTGRKRVAILYIATGKYIIFWEKFYKNMEKYFLPRHQKTYFLFTDHDDLEVPQNVVKIHQDQLPWPYVTFKRFHFFEGVEAQLQHFDYIYFLNGTMMPIQTVNEEIFPTKEQKIMVTIHPGYWNVDKTNLPYDRNKKSKAYISHSAGRYYFMGGFNGGTSEGFLDLIKTCRQWSDIDMQNNQMPVWHDESMLNAYMENKFMKEGNFPLILFPEYAIPENSVEWGLDELYPYTKMLIIDKSKHGGHDFLRGVSR